MLLMEWKKGSEGEWRGEERREREKRKEKIEDEEIVIAEIESIIIRVKMFKV